MSGSCFCDTFCVSHCHWDVETSSSWTARALQLPARSRSDKLCQYLSLNIFISENVTTWGILYACHSVPVYTVPILKTFYRFTSFQHNRQMMHSGALCNGLFFASFIRFYKDSSTGDQRLMDNPDIIRAFNGYYTIIQPDLSLNSTTIKK